MSNFQTLWVDKKEKLLKHGGCSKMRFIPRNNNAYNTLGFFLNFTLKSFLPFSNEVKTQSNCKQNMVKITDLLFDKCNLECFYCFDFHYYMAWDKLTWRLTTSDLTAAINLHGVKKGRGSTNGQTLRILLRNERENSTFSLEDKCPQVFPICIKLLLTYDHTCAPMFDRGVRRNFDLVIHLLKLKQRYNYLVPRAKLHTHTKMFHNFG